MVALTFDLDLRTVHRITISIHPKPVEALVSNVLGLIGFGCMYNNVNGYSMAIILDYRSTATSKTGNVFFNWHFNGMSLSQDMS